MPPAIAAVIFSVGVLAMFVLDRERRARNSKALWIPVIWVSLNGSRMVSQWLGIGSPILTADQALDGNPLDRVILAGLIVAGMVVLLGRTREVGKLLRSNRAIVVFISYCALSILWSDYPDVAFKRWTKAAGDLVMVLVVLTDPDRSAAVKRFLASIGFLLLPASVLFIKYFPSLGQMYGGMEQKNVLYSGVAIGKNSLGQICLVAGIACSWRLIEAYRGRDGARRVGPLIVQGALLAMVLWLLSKADSATSLACFVLASGVMAVSSSSVLVRKGALVHLLVVTVICVAFLALFLGFGAEFVGRSATLTGRTGLWADLLRVSAHPLFGAGFESFWLGARLEELWGIYWWRPNEAHNGYLEVFLNLGWIGVALLAVLIAIGYRNVVNRLQSDPDTGGLRLGYFVAGLVYAFTEVAFRVLGPIWIVFLLAIVTVPKTDAPSVQSARLSRFRRRLRARPAMDSVVSRYRGVRFGSGAGN